MLIYQGFQKKTFISILDGFSLHLLNTGVSAGPGTPLPTAWLLAGRLSDIPSLDPAGGGTRLVPTHCSLGEPTITDTHPTFPWLATAYWCDKEKERCRSFKVLTVVLLFIISYLGVYQPFNPALQFFGGCRNSNTKYSKYSCTQPWDAKRATTLVQSATLVHSARQKYKMTAVTR